MSIYKNISSTIRVIPVDNLALPITDFFNDQDVANSKTSAKNKTLQNVHQQLSYQVLTGSLRGNWHMDLGWGQCKHDETNC